MKTVFSSNSELSKVWAKQTQQIGRASNMFFEGNHQPNQKEDNYIAPI